MGSRNLLTWKGGGIGVRAVLRGECETTGPEEATHKSALLFLTQRAQGLFPSQPLCCCLQKSHDDPEGPRFLDLLISTPIHRNRYPAEHPGSVSGSSAPGSPRLTNSLLNEVSDSCKETFMI